MMKRNIFVLFLCLVIGYTWVSAQVTLRDSVEIDVFHGKMLPDSFTNLKGTNVQSNHKLSVTPSTLVIPKTGNLIVSYQHADLLSMVWRMHPEETLNLYFVDRDSMVSDTLKDRFDFSFDYRVYYAGNNCAPIWSSGDYIDYDYYFYTGKPQQWDLGPVEEGEFVQLSYTAEADTCDYSTYERGRALKPFYNCHFYTCYDSLGQITGWDVKLLPGSIWWLNTWQWERLTFHLGVVPPEKQLNVRVLPDTLGCQDTSFVSLQAVDAEGKEIDLADDEPFNVTLDPTGQQYGGLLHLARSGLTTELIDIPYQDFIDGKIAYTVNSSLPDSTIQANIKVMGQDQPELCDSASITLDEAVTLEINAPEDSVSYIQPEPAMPILEFKAELEGCDQSALCVAEWTYEISYDYPSGSDTEEHLGEAAFVPKVPHKSTLISEWELDLSNTRIIGGEATVSVSAEFEGETYTDTLIHYIRGENPDDEDVTEGLDTGEKTMLKIETSGFDQFDTEDYAEPNEGLPLCSDADEHGWGMCQIDDRWHIITTDLLWEWTANLTYGINYYNTRRNAAENLLETLGGLDIVAEGQTRQSMIDSEAYARYNGGGNARYWNWIEPTRNNPIGYWEVNPAMMNNGIREYNPNVDANVGRYINNYQ
ncbi:MAG: hypothetical protein U5R06_13520 [candidate division KSB1 bacterium]|nr:hypothetical protein [candidate division KSB1 bacterium]